MMRMQLNITLKYSIMNELIIKERIYLSAKKRYNIKSVKINIKSKII